MEETLWHALRKTQLISPIVSKDDAISWEGCEFSKCGRTDRGVSAFGQVVGLKVRSNKPLKFATNEGFPPLVPSQISRDADAHPRNNLEPGHQDGIEPLKDDLSFDDIREELPYIKILNRVLPEDIRALAWCPSPPGFSARFSCRERRYRYFFTQPAFKPPRQIQPNDRCAAENGGKAPQGYLNIEAMQTAAKKFEGLHDFRNFCKIDPSKQIENFQRRIFRSEIVAVSPLSPSNITSSSVLPPLGITANTNTRNLAHHAKTYAFILHGSAFLWHQVRHMVAILFLIGQGLESPILIDDLLNISKTPSKPRYDMADDAPLVLWDCIFPKDLSELNEMGYEDSLPWITESGPLASSSSGVNGLNNDNNNNSNENNNRFELNGKYARGGVAESIWKVWRKANIDEVLAGELLDVVEGYRHTTLQSKHQEQGQGYGSSNPEPRSERVFLGGNEAKLAGKYVPVMQRPRMEGAEVVNAKWAKKKNGVVVKEEEGGEKAKEV